MFALEKGSELAAAAAHNRAQTTKLTQAHREIDELSKKCQVGAGAGTGAVGAMGACGMGKDRCAQVWGMVLGVCRDGVVCGWGRSARWCRCMQGWARSAGWV